MPKRRPRKPAIPPRPSAATPASRDNPDLAFSRPIRTGGAWFPSVWPS